MKQLLDRCVRWMVCVFCFIGLVEPAHSGVLEWTGGGPEGGTVRALVADPTASGTFYVGTNRTGVYKSTDGGLTFERANFGGERLVAGLSIANDGTLFTSSAGSEDPFQVGRSTDGGATWTLSGTGLGTVQGSRGIAVAPSDSSRVYVSTGQAGVFVSTDGGASFSAANTGLPSLLLRRGLAVHPTDPLTVWVGTQGGGVWKTTDGGATWAASNGGLPSARVESLAVDPATPTTLLLGNRDDDRIYRSTDGGANWVSSATGYPGGNYPRSFAFDPASPMTVYMVDSTSGYKSTDGGMSWADATATDADRYLPAQVAVDSGSSLNVYVGTADGILRSVDSGTTWTRSASGLNASNGSSLVYEPSDPDVVYSLWTGPWKSTDGASSWTEMPYSTTTVQSAGYGSVSPAMPGLLYLPGDSGFELYRSTDGGTSWSPRLMDLSPFDPFGPFLSAVAASPDDPDILMVGNVSTIQMGFPISPAVLRSTDGGATWSGSYTPPDVGGSFFAVLKLWYSPHDSDHIYVSGFYPDNAGVTNHTLLRSTDGGANWSEVLGADDSRFVADLAFDSVSAAHLWAVVARTGLDDDVMLSTDGGVTWTSVLTQACGFALATLPGVTGTAYSSGCGELLVTDDFGATWTSFDTTGLAPDTDLFFEITVTDEPTIYTATDTGIYAYSLPFFADGFESGDASGWGVTSP